LAASGYRCSATASDLADGETLARTLPPALLVTLACTEARSRRGAQLRSCDWTQVADAPLTNAQRAAWQSYRQALRTIPDRPGFPAEIQWPEVPRSVVS
jgi:Phage tail assembly chaperone protein